MITKYYEKIKTIIRENIYFLLSLAAIICLFTFELPYVIYTPGGAIELSNRIEVENGYDYSGSFSMAYVSMVKGNIPFLLLSYLLPNWDIVPTKDIKPQNETLDEMIEADRISMLQAQNNAIYASFSLAKKEIRILSQTNHIVYISELADTDLELFDEILCVNGKEIQNLADLQDLISSLQVGERVSLKVKRDDEELEKYAIVYPTTDGLKIGISISTTYDYETNPAVTISSKSSESGPSGGLMMALSIYNSLVEEDITRGKTIIGTGTIDHLGNVGEIGGVKYKLLGAIRKKADIFLVPEGNYEEAIAVKNQKKSDIRVISVKTLQDAIDAISK